MIFNHSSKHFTTHLRKVRDLTLFSVNEDEYVVIASDSIGGIGSKSLDPVQTDLNTVGAFALRVPLFELVCCGAKPFLVTSTLSVEWDPTGYELVEAMKRYAQDAGLVEDIQFTGSTEENIIVNHTGIGITVLGLVRQEHFRPDLSKRHSETGKKIEIGKKSQLDQTQQIERDHDIVVAVGIPKSSPDFEITLQDPEIISLAELYLLRSFDFVGDMVPVGSKGIDHEAQQLAIWTGKTYVKCSSPIDMRQSGGPSTCVIFVTQGDHLEHIQRILQTPVHQIGQLQ